MTESSLNWRELERQRTAQLQALGTPVRGVTWTCNHMAHDALDMTKHHLPTRNQIFTLRGRRYAA